MTKDITVYTLEELKDANPEAFEKVHEKWKEGCDTPWSDELLESLKAVVDACGGTLKNWSIGAYSPSSIDVRVNDEDEDDDAKDARWFRLNVLKPHGYTKANGHAQFPGLCAFTGYCADDDLLEAVYKNLQAGDTLTEALEGLADVCRQHMEDDLEQHQQEDPMLANWGDRLFTIDGKPV